MMTPFRMLARCARRETEERRNRGKGKRMAEIGNVSEGCKCAEGEERDLQATGAVDEHLSSG